jgi:DNA adenine methylase
MQIVNKLFGGYNMDSFGWMGGKKLLRTHIAKLIPADITFYIEVFGGAAWVLLYKDRWARHEVYNDLDNRLVNLFMQIKWHPDELIREFEDMLNSRSMFLQIKNNKGITEIQKAARFLFLLKNSFGSLGSHFGTSKKSGGAALGGRNHLINRLKKINQRFDKVVIENKSYEDLIKLYDEQTNFFYCDPPYYHGKTYDNSKDFNHEVLRDILSNIKGRFLLSYDNCPEIKKLYKDFRMIELSRTKGINRKYGKSDYQELLIMNYDIDANKQIDLEFNKVS